MPLPAIGVAVAGALALGIPYLVAQVLIALGLTFVAYVGLTPLLEQVTTYVNTATSGGSTIHGVNTLALFLYAGGGQIVQMWVAGAISGSTVVLSKPLLKRVLAS